MELIYYLENHTPSLLVLEVALMIIIFLCFLMLYLYNRKKYHALRHQIPAGVVKNYLDSIIQNSSALKSSLFRGGGLEFDENGIPSVMKVSGLPGGESLGVANVSEDGSQLNAEIAALRAQVGEKNITIKDLEERLKNLEGTSSGSDDEKVKSLEQSLKAAQDEIEKLKNQKPDGAGADSAELEKIKSERDELKDKLEEYEVIEDDLANLKKLKQENEQLRKSLGESAPSEESTTVDGSDAQKEPAQTIEGGSESNEEAQVVSGGSEKDDDATLVSGGSDEKESVDIPTSQTAPEEVDEAPTVAPEQAEDTAPSEDEESNEPVQASAEEDSDDAPTEEEKKTPEDLLSEFEKMLG